MNPSTLVWLFLQEGPSPVPTVLIVLAVYAFTAFCFQKIAERTSTEPAWWAWIPILNVLLMLKIAGRPLWWIVLFLVPLVNIVIAVLVLVNVCQKRGKSGWLAVGFFIPVVNLFALGYLAFAD